MTVTSTPGVGPGTATVAGADGCPGGWAVVTWPEARVRIVEDLGPVIDEVRRHEIAALAIDMPIGLLDHHPRAADVAARRFVGPRRSSVFPTPLRVVLDATDYEDACRRSRDACGVAPSRQAWNLVPKIRQLDAVIRVEDQDRIVEAHPECAFRRLAGHPLDHPKSTPQGRSLRRALLHRELGDEVDRILGEHAAPIADLLDAMVLTVTAAHLRDGTAVRLGDERDEQGRRAEIVY